VQMGWNTSHNNPYYGTVYVDTRTDYHTRNLELQSQLPQDASLVDFSPETTVRCWSGGMADMFVRTPYSTYKDHRRYVP
jgi:hypothetical protein